VISGWLADCNLLDKRLVEYAALAFQLEVAIQYYQTKTKDKK
jgi:hypothetical protein